MLGIIPVRTDGLAHSPQLADIKLSISCFRLVFLCVCVLVPTVRDTLDIKS